MTATKNNSIIISKQSMDDYSIVKYNSYAIGYFVSAEPSKEACEDAILINYDNGHLILAVCDGVGSTDRSYRAAKKILDKIDELPSNIKKEELQQELLEHNKKLIALEGSPQTTLTLISIYKDNYYCLQAGDSGLIHCSNHGNLKYRNTIHSPVGKAVEQEQITEKQALVHPELHIVENVLGCHDSFIDISEDQQIAKNDTIILTSDGLLDNYISQDLIDLISKSTLEDACSKLVESTKTGKNIIHNKDFNKIDDISFIILKHI